MTIPKKKSVCLKFSDIDETIQDIIYLDIYGNKINPIEFKKYNNDNVEPKNIFVQDLYYGSNMNENYEELKYIPNDYNVKKIYNIHIFYENFRLELGAIDEDQASIWYEFLSPKKELDMPDSKLKRKKDYYFDRNYLYLIFRTCSNGYYSSTLLLNFFHKQTQTILIIKKCNK